MPVAEHPERPRRRAPTRRGHLLYRYPKLPAAVAAGLLLLAPPLRATGVGDLPSWRTGVEFLSLALQDGESHLVRDHAVTFGADGATLTFHYEDGGTLELALVGGGVLVDGKRVGRYPPGGALATAWWELATAASHTGTADALALVQGWEPTGLSRTERAYTGLFRSRAAELSASPDGNNTPRPAGPAPSGGLVIDLADLSDTVRLASALSSVANLQGPAVRITVPGGQARLGPFGVGTGERLEGHLLVIRGDANVYGTVRGNLATVEGDILVHPGAIVTGDVLAVAGQVRDLGGEIGGRILTTHPAPVLEQPPQRGEPILTPTARLVRNGAGVAGSALTLLLLGFGLVLFARGPLEVVSDTVLHSFSRALVVGVLGQILVLPTFGMLVVGLVLSVAGILLVPFAVVAFALLLLLAVLGGFLAVLHAMGETLTRRQLAAGARIGSANSYRYVAGGLAGVTALWLGWVLFGWVPLAGELVLGSAALVTWLLATVGLGAALLSRGGMRDQFAGRLLPPEALTDEYLWATPRYGVTAVSREQASGKHPSGGG